MKIRTYRELIAFPTFEERFRYLKLSGIVGKETFGFDRYFNQAFYRSREWKRIRDQVVIRDNGCDLGIAGREIYGTTYYIHHMNPITLEDLETHSDYLLNPDYLITTTHATHNAIHYGDESLLIIIPPERFEYDTCPWRQRRSSNE